MPITIALGSCYQTVFLELLDRCEQLAHSGRRKFRFENKLLSLKATVIDLCAQTPCRMSSTNHS